MHQHKITVDVHGSCVSRNIFNVEEDAVEVNNHFSRNNIASCMMPAADIPVRQEELLFSSDYSYRCITHALDKSTLPLLLQSDSDFLVIDFYDFCQPVAAYQNTTFSTYDYSLLLAPSLQPYLKDIAQVNFLELPSYLWYGYVDLYFESVKRRFRDNIVLVRLCCCNKYISKSGEVLPTPARLLRYGNAKYNDALRKLEDYVIERHAPYVIDVTKYFIADESHNADVTPVHFEENYQIAAWNIMKHIIERAPTQKYFDYLPASIVADLLLLPVSTEDFWKIWNDIPSPFSARGFLDGICAKFPDEDIVQNRKWLGKAYKLYSSFLLDAGPEQDARSPDAFIKAVAQWPTDSAFSAAFAKLLVQE